MPVREETVRLRFTQLVAGWYDQRHRYSAWRPGGTDDWLMVLTVGGRGRFGFAGGELVARPGDLVLLQPGTLHDYGLESVQRRWELLWTHFHPRSIWIDWLNWPAVAPGLMRLQLRDHRMRLKIRRRFVDVVTLLNTTNRRRDDLAMNALEELLLWCDAGNPVSHQPGIDPRIRQMMDHICRNPGQVLTLDSLAEISGLSVSRVAHLFRKQAGMPPQQFVELQRINRARQLLEYTAMSVKEIAIEVGYQNPFYFTARFNRQVGLSPRDYRRKQA